MTINILITLVMVLLTAFLLRNATVKFQKDEIEFLEKRNNQLEKSNDRLTEMLMNIGSEEKE